MKKTVVIALLCVAAAFSLRAQQTKPKATNQDLVSAAKQSKAKRKKSATKVITNKDVKKANGKLIELPPSKKPAAKVVRVPTIEEQDAAYKQRKETSERYEAAQKSVDKLQKQVDEIEQQYYEENDPNYRDNVIQKRFEQAKRQLQDAQQELADARDAKKKLTPSPQK